MKQVIRVAARILLGLGLILLALIIVPIVGQSLESSWFPVLKPVHIEIEKRTDTTLTITAYGEKSGRKCAYNHISAFVLRDGEWHRAKFTLDAQGAPRPPGLQAYSGWNITPYGTRLRLVASHRCHWAWETTSILGEWATGGRDD